MGAGKQEGGTDYFVFFGVARHIDVTTLGPRPFEYAATASLLDRRLAQTRRRLAYCCLGVGQRNSIADVVRIYLPPMWV